MQDKEKMMKAVQTYTFAALDAALYLDAYPDSKEGLSYFNKYRNLANEAVAAYEEKYGPLTIDGAGGDGRWNWTDSAWPWEYGG